MGGMHQARRQNRLVRRLVQLYLGLVAYGLSMALLVRGELGVMPWDVLHQGLSRHLPLTLGQVTIGVGVLVLLLWIPLREKPGLGTVSNVVVIGLAVDAWLAVLPEVTSWWARVLLVVAGVTLNAAATAAYIGVHLGSGPRDGLMTGLVRRTGGSVRLVRTGIEVVVVAVGWLLGGVLGVATVVYAVGIGPLTQVFMPALAVPPARPRRSVPCPSTA
ncbi:MAG: YczE/YyaS/YitT family protein [Actinomycetes bacterium]